VGALAHLLLFAGQHFGGAIVAHGNLFGQGKRGVIGGRISNVDSGALAAYEDPAVWGSWIFFTVKGKYQLQIIPEYSNEYGNLSGLPLSPMRNTKLRSYGGDINVGVAWFRKVRTSVGGFLTRTTSSGQPAILTTVLPRFSTCRQARPADGGAPPRPM